MGSILYMPFAGPIGMILEGAGFKMLGNKKR